MIKPINRYYGLPLTRVSIMRLWNRPFPPGTGLSTSTIADASYPATFEAYKYTDLPRDDSIRLLELLPARDGPLKCTLFSVRLQEDPDFEALSYTWGAPEFPNTLRIDPSNCLLKITDNLNDALLALRLQEESRRLWVDAVCINQKDPEEKKHQVPMMKSIYQGARRAIIWLGKDADDPEQLALEREGVQVLKQIGGNCQLYGFEKIFPFPRIVPDRKAFQNLISLGTDVNVRSLLKIYEWEWYERLWIIQEFVLARDLVLQFGSHSISYDLFSKATAVFKLIGRRTKLLIELSRRQSYFMSIYYTRGFENAWRLIQQRERYWGMNATQYSVSSEQRSVYAYEDPTIRPSSMIEYCAIAKDFKCTNEVDRIYGMLGLAHDAGLDIPADESLSPTAVWENLAREVLRKGDLTVLHYAGKIDHVEPSIRSFAVDFGRWKGKAERLGGHGYPRFHSATSLPANVDLEPDGCVRVHAIKVDTVNDVILADYDERRTTALDGSITRDDCTEVRRPAGIESSEQAAAASPKFIPAESEVLHKLYKWWLICFHAEGLPPWYSDKEREVAFRRMLVADLALPSTKALLGNFSMHTIDCLCAVHMLAQDGVDESGNQVRFVDSWKVYEWLGRTESFGLRTFEDDPSPSKYFFPTIFGDEDADLLWHEFSRIAENGGNPSLLLDKGILDKPVGGKQIIRIDALLQEQLNSYKTAVSKILTERCVFFTNLRMLGLGPKSMLPGDVVMVPEGSQTPFVYRPAEESHGHVRKGYLVGECYVYGLMNGDPVERLNLDYEESHIEVILM